ncbi:hypothetical protein T06_25, partial [Trichinella sp. T6]
LIRLLYRVPNPMKRKEDENRVKWIPQILPLLIRLLYRVPNPMKRKEDEVE